MSEILFIRHAETAMAGTFCGHSDPELNERGMEQVTDLIKRLRGENIHSVYSSDLRRAHAMGVAIAEAFDVEYHLRTGLRELHFGEWEGLSWSEIEQRDADYAARWIAEYPKLEAPGGESFEGFEKRVLAEIAFLSDVRRNRCVAVVTHAGVLRKVIRHFSQCSEDAAWERTKSYCCLIRFSDRDLLSAQPVEVGFEPI